MRSQRLRAKLVDRLLAAGSLTDDAVAAALRTVPRELFLPEYDLATVYTDKPLVIKRDDTGEPISSSSQPTIMAMMLEQLDVHRGHRVLELGAGSGYNAALLAELTGDQQLVVSLDIDPDIAARATTNLAAAGYPDVHTVCADGAAGFAAEAPYDRIIATVGVWDIAPAWLDQLAPGGVLVVPIALAGAHRSIAFVRADEHLVSKSIVDCGFMRIRGSHHGPEVQRTVDESTDLQLTVHDGQNVDELTLTLRAQRRRIDTGIDIDGWGEITGLLLWLADTGYGRVDVYESSTAVPALLGNTHLDISGNRMAPGIGGAAGLALLTRAASGTRLLITTFGDQADGPAEVLAARARTWDAAGRPSSDNLRVVVCPAGVPPPAGHTIVRRNHVTLALSWA